MEDHAMKFLFGQPNILNVLINECWVMTSVFQAVHQG